MKDKLIDAAIILSTLLVGVLIVFALDSVEKKVRPHAVVHCECPK